MIKIDKNIPIPEKQPKASKYPFLGMKKGDSFFIEMDNQSQLQYNRLTSSIRTSKKRMGQDYRITLRKVEGGIRCWRME